MKFLYTLAFKNLWRYKRRTFITASALAAGVALYIYMDAFLLGIQLDSERNIVWYETGAAKVLDRDAVETDIQFFTLRYLIEQPEAVEQLLQSFNYPFTRRITFTGELFFSEGYLSVQCIGIDPATDGGVFRLEEAVAAGEYLSTVTTEQGLPGPGAYETLIGAGLAEDLHARLGDLVTVRTRTRYGAWQTLDVTIKGIINSPNPVINSSTLYLPLETVDQALQMEGAVTEIPVYIPAWVEAEEEIAGFKAVLEHELPELTVQTWQELAADFIALSQSKTVGNTILLVLIFIIAAVGISNTMLMSVFERVREIGMMRALGMSDRKVLLSFLVEAAGIGIVGSLIGLGVGALATYYTVEYGIDFSALIGNMETGYRIAGVFRAAWHPEALVIAFFTGIGMCIAVAFFPASRALKMDVTAALRYA